MCVIRVIVISRPIPNMVTELSFDGLVVCVIMMKLKVRLETDEWIYEEHEMI